MIKGGCTVESVTLLLFRVVVNVETRWRKMHPRRGIKMGRRQSEKHYYSDRDSTKSCEAKGIVTCVPGVRGTESRWIEGIVLDHVVHECCFDCGGARRYGLGSSI